MKVCTDACILGAIAAKRFAHMDARQNVLDIGTGTGLLSLMLAQSIPANIDAIEIDSSACEQAKQNVLASPWSNRIQVIHAALQTFKSQQPYELIISNPPFFSASLTSPDPARKAAMHDESLSLEELLQFGKNNLSADGKIIVLLPRHRLSEAVSLGDALGLHNSYQMAIRHSNLHPWFRIILEWQATPVETVFETLDIRNNEGAYSSAFINLLQPFYLHL